MNVVTCSHCMHIFGQDEDEKVASAILMMIKESFKNCPRCKRSLEVTIGWASGPMDNRPRDVVREINLDSDKPPDPSQLGRMLRDDIKAIVRKRKKKKSWLWWDGVWRP